MRSYFLSCHTVPFDLNTTTGKLSPGLETWGCPADSEEITIVSGHPKLIPSVNASVFNLLQRMGSQLLSTSEERRMV